VFGITLGRSVKLLVKALLRRFVKGFVSSLEKRRIVE